MLVSSDWSWFFFFSWCVTARAGETPIRRPEYARACSSTGPRFTTLTLNTSAESCDTVNYGIINKHYHMETFLSLPSFTDSSAYSQEVPFLSLLPLAKKLQLQKGPYPNCSGKKSHPKKWQKKGQTPHLTEISPSIHSYHTTHTSHPHTPPFSPPQNSKLGETML